MKKEWIYRKYHKLCMGTLSCVLTGFLLSSCATTHVGGLPPVPPAPPGYVTVPHPEGMDLGDLMAIFTDRTAPSPEQIKTCDQDYRLLRSRTTSKEEITQGAKEFVQRDPVKYHWCLYGKLLELENALDQDLYVDERQKAVTETFLFVTPIARAFHQEYKDSRYLRWAIQRYRKISEFVFYRKVEQSSAMTQELLSVSNPFGFERGGRTGFESVLDKYGLVSAPAVEPLPQTPVAQLPAGPVQNEKPTAAPPAAQIEANSEETSSGQRSPATDDTEGLGPPTDGETQESSKSP